MARLTVIMVAVWVVFVIAFPLATSSAPRLQSPLNDEPSHNFKGPSSPQQQDPAKASKDINNFVSSAPDVSAVLQNSTFTLSTVPPLSNSVPPQSRKPNPADGKVGDNAIPLPPPVGVGNASVQNILQGNSRQSNISLSGKGSTIQNISKAQQIDVGKQSDDIKATVNDNSDFKPSINASESREQSPTDIKGEIEGKNKSSENNTSKSPHPGLREDLGSKPSSNETVVSSTNQSKSPAVPVSPTPVKPEEERTGGKDIPSAVSKGVTPSSTTTTTTGPVNIKNIDLLRPPLQNSFGGYDEDEQLSSVVPVSVGIESYQRPEEPDPALPDVSRGDEKVVPQIDSGGNFSDDEDSHFFAYFLTIVVTAIIFYLVFHNKQRIIALIIEGRAPRSRNRRSSSRARYHKLDNNLEEAMSGTKGPKYERIY